MSSLWFSSPERFGLEDDGFEDIDSPPRDMSLLRNQVQSVFQAQMNKETTTAFLDHSQNESCSPFDHLFPSREDNCFTPSMPTFSSSEMPVLSNSIAPPAPPAPPVPQMRRHQNYHYNMAYHGAPSGLYPYSGTSSTSLNGYTPYLPEEVFQPSSPQAPPALATPRLGSATISQLPNPFTTAYGHTPKPPTIPLAPPPAQPLTARKLAAAARPRDASGKFAPRSKVTDDQSSDPTIIVTVSNPSSKLKSPSLTYISPAHPTYPSPQSYTSPPANYTPSSLQRSPHSYSSPALPSSPEMLEAHVATLQQQLAQEKAESERLRALLDQTQSELMQLKLNATHWPPLNQHNKRARSISSIDSASWHSDVFQN